MRLIRKICIIIILGISNQIFATDYFVSNSGNDNNDGLTENSAWQTIGKVNLEMFRFNPGDHIYFKKGEIFYGTLKISKVSGTQGNEIIFEGYGLGINPIITNGKSVNNWTHYSGNIYSTNVSESVYQVFKNNQPLLNARTSLKDIFKVSSVDSQTIFSSDQLKGMDDLVGATVILKVRSWYLSNRKITSFNSGSGKITINKKPNYDMRSGNEFFITNHVNLLDEEGEWSFDPLNQKLYLFSSTIPTNIVAAVSDNHGIEILQSNHIKINDLIIRHVNNAGIFTKSSFCIM